MEIDKLLAKSLPKLNTVHASIKEKGIELIKQAHKEGIYILITHGLRTHSEQNALYEQGRTKSGKIVTNVKGGYSYHNFGLAIDFAVYTDATCKSINWTVDKRWKRVGAIGQSLGLEWGGAWKSFIDYPHFQLTFGLTTSDLRNGKKAPLYTPIVTEKEKTTNKTIEEDDLPMKTEQWQKDLFINGIQKYSKVKYGKSYVISNPDDWIKKVKDETITAGEVATLAFTILTRVQ